MTCWVTCDLFSVTLMFLTFCFDPSKYRVSGCIGVGFFVMVKVRRSMYYLGGRKRANNFFFQNGPCGKPELPLGDENAI